MNISATLSLIPFIAACFIVALSGAVFRPGEWYEGLAKPAWRPPNWLFGPAWTVLYICIAVSGWFVWRQVGFTGAPVAMSVYAIQLLLNAGWSACSFGLRRLDLAFGELILLWLSIVANIAVFAQISATAMILLIPYLAWVTFAGVLNFRLWQMNRVLAERPG
ncbi:TspO/MBR family protein [Acidisphaera sp. L21]|uniref:TspO/MBR family protein n=1 Tax=Acidisphaera sp. L21 TaxID=1641851 RepID=UPI00131D9B89|nr:TspO/MBR family protein [Acidisphaera sp. L21]